MHKLFTFTVALALALPATAAPASETLVVCSPGAPGTTDEAQPTMDALASAISGKAKIAIGAVYEPSEHGGIARMQKAGLALVSLPFFLAHERELGLHARLVAVQKGRPALDRWALVAQKGRISSASSLAGFTILASTASEPAFVRGIVLGKLGVLPATAKLSTSAAVLSGLRHAADGSAVAVVLDGTQLAALASLPFKDKLEVATASDPLPAGIVATIDARLPGTAWTAIDAALRGLDARALDAVQLAGFQPIDPGALDAARHAFASAAP